MAATKRKEAVGHKADESQIQRKRRRVSPSTTKNNQTPKQINGKSSVLRNTQSQLLQPSVLAKEPPAFPRGGADILTPLEKKQIRNKAETDALQEINLSDNEVKKQKSSKLSRQAQKEKRRIANGGGIPSSLKYEDLSEGMVLLGRVTKATESRVLVQLSDSIVGSIALIDLADDYSKADPFAYAKDEVIRTSILRIDTSKKRIMLSARPSKVLTLSLPAVDREITSIEQLRVGDVVRGFIRNISDIGIFVNLGHGVAAFVRVSHLSDAYLKDWKADFHEHQLVKGKIIAADRKTGRLQISLKNSVMRPDYVPLLTLHDLQVGQIVTGKVAKVEDYGLFIVVDHSENVRGLCHRSELAEVRVADARKFFNEGDAVKAKILKIDLGAQKIAFGLKASYFGQQTEKPQTEGDKTGGDLLSEASESETGSHRSDDEGESLAAEDDTMTSELDDSIDDEESQEQLQATRKPRSNENNSAKPSPSRVGLSHLSGLQVGGFNWNGLPQSSVPEDAISSTPDIEGQKVTKARKRNKPKIQEDLTGDLDTHGPQSASDFERLLLSEPDSSLLWLQYMAMHLALGEVSTARQLGQRALRTISSLGQAEAEKLNVWIALLNLENTYADTEAVEETFKSACEVNDPQEVHERLVSIYIQSSKYEKADELFQTMLRKFGSKDPKVWINYATFLSDAVNEPDKGRALLSRALQTLPDSAHIDITVKFATLEFRSKRNGLPERGRTIFEGLIDSFPKRVDLWNVLLDLEMRYMEQNAHSSSEDNDNGNNAASLDGVSSTGVDGVKNDQQVSRKEKPERKVKQHGGSSSTSTSVQHIRQIFERIFADNTHSSGRTKSIPRPLKNKQAKFFFKRWLEFEESKVGEERAIEAVKRRAAAWVRKRQEEAEGKEGEGGGGGE